MVCRVQGYMCICVNVNVCKKGFCCGVSAGICGVNQILAIVSQSLCCSVFVVPTSANHFMTQLRQRVQKAQWNSHDNNRATFNPVQRKRANVCENVNLSDVSCSPPAFRTQAHGIVQQGDTPQMFSFISNVHELAAKVTVHEQHSTRWRKETSHSALSHH